MEKLENHLFECEDHGTLAPNFLRTLASADIKRGIQIRQFVEPRSDLGSALR